MNYYFAPMEGITGYLYRNVHRTYYKGITAYYAPFITTTKNGIKKTKEIRDILPENNPDIPLIPQLLTNQADQFLEYQKVIADLGYQEVNLNFGCPSKTVVTKGRGAGFLQDLWEMEQFFDKIFSKCEIDVSVKTRIGMDSPEEFLDLMDVYRKYPIRFLIIHPRTQSDYYKNHPDLDAFRLGLEKSTCPVCYNGDIKTLEDIEHLKQQFPDLEHVMIGRGLLTDPALAEKLLCEEENKAGQNAAFSEKLSCEEADETGQHIAFSEQKETKRLRQFHDALYGSYRSAFSGEKPVLFKMKELWVYLGEQFPGEEKVLKQIRKAQRLADYESAARYLLG